MSKIPKNPNEIFEEIIHDFKALFSDDLVSIILYGSAASGDYIPGKSDINLMVVLSDEEIEHIDKAFKAIAKWQKRKVAVPLFLTEQYIETSTDVFPIEYLNFQRNHMLLYGKDVLSELTFDRHDVRLQCEREIKGKLLILREAYLESKGKGKALKEVIVHSFQAFLALFTSLLFFKEKDVPLENREIVSSVSHEYGLDSELLNQLLDIKEEKTKLNDIEMKTL
ncbi:MAG: nucleotidyltransferase domain-containing protein, partial [Deltaproteobacteria bacterium]|nr:nucleotidyltransferase domain-containing protein [Deltaproteobacteria bacterium]